MFIHQETKFLDPHVQHFTLLLLLDNMKEDGQV